MRMPNPCRCAFVRHPTPGERSNLEMQKVEADVIAAVDADPDRRINAKTTAAVLYVVLYTECLTAPELNVPIMPILRRQQMVRQAKKAHKAAS